MARKLISRIIKAKDCVIDGKEVKVFRLDENVEPEVILHRDDDGTVRKIEVVCKCGEHIILELEYME